MTAEIDWKGVRWKLSCDAAGCDVRLIIETETSDVEVGLDFLETTSGNTILLLGNSLGWQIVEPKGVHPFRVDGHHLCPRCKRLLSIEGNADTEAKED